MMAWEEIGSKEMLVEIRNGIFADFLCNSRIKFFAN